MNHEAIRDLRAAATRHTLRTLVVAAVGVAIVLLLLVCLLAGTGLLYGLRGLRWFGLGARIEDSLPLLQLAGFDGQPLARVAAAWLPAGMVFGLALIRLKPLQRTAIAGMLGLLALLFASDAAFALARNLRLSYVLSGRAPGLGAWLEALLFAAGSALPRPFARLRWRRSPVSVNRDPPSASASASASRTLVALLFARSCLACDHHRGSAAGEK
jgi:hypothetical protein